jgi:pre-mRNA-processing factor 40
MNMNMQGRGPPMRPPMGRGMGRGPPMGGRGNNMMGRGNNMDRGPMPGRGPPMQERGPPMMGRGHQPMMGPGPPPPPPGRGFPLQHHLPPHHGQPHGQPNVPPPPMRYGFPGQQPPGMPPPMTYAPPPPFPPQRHLQQPPPGGPPNRFPQHQPGPQPHVGAARPGAPSGYPGYSAGPRTAGAPPPATPAAAPPASTYTKEQIDQAWKEFTAPSGVKYYHNSLTTESTYTKPAIFAQRETASTAAAAATASSPAERQWQEYQDANTGKKYYSDGVTTKWEKPAGFQSDTETPAAEEPEPPKKKKKAEATKETVFNNGEEAVAAFKGLLLAKDISPTAKWNEAVKICSSDSRWEACEEVLTVGERRQALAEYQTKRANELRNLERQERIRAKDAFGQLLTDLLPSVTTFSAWSSRFADLRSALSKDDRFYAVEDEATRANLFLDFCEEFRKRDERKKRNRKREAMEAFLSFLKEKEEAGDLTFASTW